MDPRNENHLHLGDISIVACLALAGVGVAGFFLISGVAAGDLVAVVLATVLAVLGLLATGAGAVLFVMGRVVKAESDRSVLEQSRWQDNTAENLQIMGAMQTVQNRQNSMLLKQARESQRALPPPEAPADLGFQFSDDILELGD